MDADDEETMEPRAISVRRMGADDEETVKALAARAFSPLESLSFPRSPDALIAERGGELLGAVVLKTFGLPGSGRDADRRGGMMLWLMVDPGARRLGVGGRLVEAALQFFEERGCREVFACVEGYNSSSANLFAARGFTILSLGEQLRRYGLLGTLLLWLRTSRLGGDVGYEPMFSIQLERQSRPKLAASILSVCSLQDYLTWSSVIQPRVSSFAVVVV